VADPTITTPPTATQTICVGGTPSALTLAYSNGTGTASYQWYSNTTSATTGGTLIAGATSASYAPPVLNTAGSFYYYGIATLSGSGCGAATSASAEVIVIADPIISTPPTGSQTVCTGGTLTPFTIASSGGTGTTSYQWYSNTTNIATGGTSIAGATNASYTPVTTAVGTLYYYSVATLSGSGCVSAASSTAAVIVVVPPTVSAQPTVTQTICDGGTATALTVAYSGGTGTASYQWYSNTISSTTGGTLIAGATTSTYTPTGLTAGTYYFYCEITLSGSACGTITSNVANVIAVADPTISTQPTATQTICVGGTPTSLTLAYTNGIGTATYQWYSNTTNATTGGTLIAGATNSIYNPAAINAAGNFYYYATVSLTGSGCGTATTVSSEVVVVADPTISVQPLTTQTNCQNGVSTPLTVTIAGGTGTTTYQWYTTLVNSTVGGVASGNGATLTPLTVLVGTAYVYCVVNTTGAGCSSATSATAEVIVLPIPSITAQPLATQTVCQDGTTSALTFTVANASGTTTYQWYSNSANSTTGGTAIAGATAVSFNPGATTVGTTYFYCVSTVSLGGSGCGTVTTVPAAVIVVGLPSIATQPTATQNICVGGTPSQLSMTYAGGTGTASYQWYSNTSNTTTGGAAFVGATSASFTPPTLNTSGSYFYYGTVTLNGAGCGMATTASSEVLVSPDPIISTQPIAAQDVCLNSPSTAINAAVSGGLGTVSYAWYSNSTQTIPGTILPGANTNTLTPANTPAGVSYYYMVATLSGNGCNAATSNFSQVTVHALPTVTATPVDNSICFGTTTDIVASGATSYVWTAAPTITSPANVAIVTVAPVGSVSYTVQGTDAFGCVNTATATVVAATQLNVQENITTNICYQTCTGAIALTPSGSGSSYTVAWNTAGVTGLNPQNLCPGNYTYTVTDNLTCSFQNTVNIAALPNNPLDNVIITQPTCFGYNNGSIDFQDASAVSFQLVNAATNATIATQPGGLFGTIGAGNYNIIYNDALGCVYDSLNFSVIAQSAQITLNLNAQAPVLCFNQVVPLTAIAGGGDGGAITVTWGSCNTVTNCILGTGNPYNYTLTSDVTLYAQATDATGCASTIQSIALNLANPVQVNLQNGTSSVTICEGDCVNMSAVASGGNNAIAIQWYEVPNAIGGTTLGPNGTSNTICPSNSTSVYVYANDGCAVPDTDTLSITVQSFPTVSFSVNAQEGCMPLTVSFTNNTTPTFNGNCLWSMDDGVTTFANCGDQVFTYTEEGTYSPTLYVISPEGCSTTYSLLAPIVVHGYPVADFSWAPQPVDVTQPVVQFTDASIDAANYLWEFAWLGASDLQNPVFIFPDEDLAEYPVCLTVENSFGCQDTMCRTIRLNSVLQVWVPNAFTPEQDGLNEVFLPVIKGGKPETYHFTIFDRWGTVVFESFEMGEPWIGDVRNGNAFAANGTYIWQLEVQPLEDRSLKLYTGFVTVIR
jgi:PKD repeat protein